MATFLATILSAASTRGMKGRTARSGCVKVKQGANARPDKTGRGTARERTETEGLVPEDRRTRARERCHRTEAGGVKPPLQPVTPPRGLQQPSHISDI